MLPFSAHPGGVDGWARDSKWFGLAWLVKEVGHWPGWVGERARELEFWRERWPWQKRLLATEFTQPLVYPPLLVLSTIRVGRCKG